VKQKILIVDGHSMIFRWPDLAARHAAHPAAAREELVRRLTALQDNSDYMVAVVFDGKGAAPSNASDPRRIKVFYSKSGQTADAIIERLAAKYAPACDVTVATDDHLERLTAESFGATSISSDQLRSEIQAGEQSVRLAISQLRRNARRLPREP